MDNLDDQVKRFVEEPPDSADPLEYAPKGALAEVLALRAELARLKHPDYVLVRREDLADALRILTYGFKQYELPTPCLEDCRSLDRLKAALEPRPAPGRSGG